MSASSWHLAAVTEVCESLVFMLVSDPYAEICLTGVREVPPRMLVFMKATKIYITLHSIKRLMVGLQKSFDEHKDDA